MELSEKFYSFIKEHADEDTSKLLLAKDKWKDIDISLAVSTINGRRKLRLKSAEFLKGEKIICADALSCEQCSSSDTANYKANLAFRICGNDPNAKIADLTGGLGIDSYFFSKLFKEVLYNEKDPARAQAAQHNFSALDRHNITVRNTEISPDAPLGNTLKDFQPDIIFLDPARRSATGRKIFLPEECSPDVLAMQRQLRQHARYLLIKLSPIADLTMLTQKFEKIKELHIVASGGECKEILLFIDFEMQDETKDDCKLHIYENGLSAYFDLQREKTEIPHLLENENELSSLAGKMLIEPGKAITKAGLFNTFGELYSLTKLGKSTHLYFSKGKEIPKFCKRFIILEILPLNNANIKQLHKKYPKAEFTSKNIPIKSEELREKTSILSGDKIHIFGAKIDFNSSKSQNCLIITETPANNHK
ncbi:MAG: THUMP-like domain-containing protein [Candidatus Cryptobacteroides sp.]